MMFVFMLFNAEAHSPAIWRHENNVIDDLYPYFTEWKHLYKKTWREVDTV